MDMDEKTPWAMEGADESDGSDKSDTSDKADKSGREIGHGGQEKSVGEDGEIEEIQCLENGG
jgi:hypothetical protein